MKEVLGVVSAMSLVAGCSSMPAAVDIEDNLDWVYVTRVENAVKPYGTQVIWINIPLKRDATVQQ